MDASKQQLCPVNWMALAAPALFFLHPGVKLIVLGLANHMTISAITIVTP